MADQDIIQTTALAVVEQQQKIVGSALVGSAGAGALAGGDSQSQFDILEQIRDLQMKSFRGIQEVVKKLSDMLSFDENLANRTKEDANELAKESKSNQGLVSDGDSGGDKEGEEKAKGLSAFTGFLAGLPGVGAIGKLLTPITAFFGKSGMLFKLFGRFGPLGAIILGFTVLYKYSDEIVKALTPALDKIKELVVKLQPVIDVFMAIGDFLIKGILQGIGQALSFVIGTIEGFIDGFTKLFTGDFTGGLSQIFESILKVIFAVPLMIINFLTPLFKNLVDLIAEPWNNMVETVHTKIGELFTGISDFFSGIYHSVIGFFVDNFNIAKEVISNDIKSMMNFMGSIITTVKDAFSNAYDSIVTFVTDLPGRILGFVANMFSPIIDFFAGIGNRIKMAVNGIIDSLPLPKFVKEKMKFDIEPTKPELDTVGTGDAGVAEKIASDAREGTETIGGKYNFQDGVLQENGKNLEVHSLGFAESIADTIGEQVKVAMDKKTGKFVVVKNDLTLAEGPKSTITGPDNISDILGSNSLDKNIKTPGISIPTIETGSNAPIIINKGGDTNNASVQTKSETYTGPLETGIDPYFDRASYNGA